MRWRKSSSGISTTVYKNYKLRVGVHMFTDEPFWQVVQANTKNVYTSGPAENSTEAKVKAIKWAERHYKNPRKRILKD